MQKAIRTLFFGRADKQTIAIQSAYQMAGHVVIAYYHGYSCKSLTLGTDPPATAAIFPELKEDAALAQGLLQFKNNPSLYTGYKPEDKLKCLDIGGKLLLILEAGPLAGAIRQQGTLPGKIAPEMAILSFGLSGLVNLSAYLAYLKPAGPDRAMQQAYADLVMLFKIRFIWQAIEALAAKCLEAKGDTIAQAEIERILAQSGYLFFVGP